MSEKRFRLSLVDRGTEGDCVSSEISFESDDFSWLVAYVVGGNPGFSRKHLVLAQIIDDVITELEDGGCFSDAEAESVGKMGDAASELIGYWASIDGSIEKAAEEIHKSYKDSEQCEKP